ncbi:MAG: hypothetical protein H6R19_782 [Proteobacteria bacterium]|nr:hypothetical protein [Pseudomonadota bacterium]
MNRSAEFRALNAEGIFPLASADASFVGAAIGREGFCRRDANVARSWSSQRGCCPNRVGCGDTPTRCAANGRSCLELFQRWCPALLFVMSVLRSLAGKLIRATWQERSCTPSRSCWSGPWPRRLLWMCSFGTRRTGSSRSGSAGASRRSTGWHRWGWAIMPFVGATATSRTARFRDVAVAPTALIAAIQRCGSRPLAVPALRPAVLRA